MKNGFDIEWTFNLNSIYKYLEANWSEKEIKFFTKRLDFYLQVFSNNQESFPFYKKEKNIRRCVLSIQTTIYYCNIPDENKVIILTLFDNRRNPNKLTI